MATQSKISIDDILQATGTGSIDKAIGNNIYGINQLQTPPAVPSSKEHQGFVFFTRPQLNLQLDNIRNSRKFMPLAADMETEFIKSSTSIHRIVRTLLDPRLMVGYNTSRIRIPPLTCPLVNNEMAFLSVLTNNALTASGWPDITVPLFTSRQGRYNEAVAFVDGMVENREQYTVDVSFRNTEQDPILYLFYIWTLYMSYVFKGQFVPYPDFLVHNRIDYNTRIFRVRLDKTRRKVTKIMSTGPAIPIASSVGEFADYNIEEPISSANKTITMRFQCMGFEIFDDILIHEFNTIVAMFKTEMRTPNREFQMVLIPPSISYMFQNRAYPRINPLTHAMEWWVERELFDIRTQLFLQSLGEADEFGTTFDPNDVEEEEGG